MPRRYKKYPDFIKNHIAETKNIYLYPEYNIPRSTARHWAKEKKGIKSKNISLDQNTTLLNQSLLREKAKSILLTKLFPYYQYITKDKIPSNEIKLKIVAAINKARPYIRLKAILCLINMSSSRYRRWTQTNCPNSPLQICLKKYPQQLKAEYISVIQKLCTQRKYQHIPLTNLYKLARKKGYVFCSLETWFKYIRILKIPNRKNKSLKKLRYKVGIRAKQKNEVFHIDITELKLLNGKKYYLQALMDNYSRKIISWNLTEKKDSQITLDTLSKYLNKMKNSTLLCDQGSENRSSKLKIIIGNRFKQVFAKVDIKQSNSVIEAFFRSLKNNFLYKKKLNCPIQLKKYIKYYIKQHNSIIPHSAFRWETPNQIYYNRLVQNQNLPKESNNSQLDQIKDIKCSPCILDASL